MAGIPVQDELTPMGGYFLIRGKHIDVDGVRLDRVINQVEDDISRIKTESYTKQQADDKFAAKTDVYTKSEVDTALNGKVSVQSGYDLISDADKAQIQANKANITAAETSIAGKASQEEVNTIKSDVAGKASVEAVTQLQTDMAVQEARMDQLVGTVPEGSADEIADARVTADGKTEANLGNAIRSQVSSLKETIDTMQSARNHISANDIGTWISGKNISSSNGTISDSASYCACPDFFNIPNYVDGIKIKSGSYNIYVALYSSTDQDGKIGFIERRQILAGKEIIIYPSDGKYLRISINSLDISSSNEVKIDITSKLFTAIEAAYNPMFEKHKNALGTMLRIAETYFNEHYSGRNRFRYQSMRNLFCNDYIADNGENATTCSGLVEACLKCIPFSSSRYVIGKNISEKYGFVSDGTGYYANDPEGNPDTYDKYDYDPYSDYMLTGGLAKYFEDHDNLFEFDANRNALHPGDILFYAKETDSTEHDNEDRNVDQSGDEHGYSHYKNINHVAICVDINDTYYTLIESASPGMDLVLITRTYTPKSWGTLKYYARNPVEKEYTTKKIYEDSTRYHGNFTSTTAEATEIKFPEPLPIGFYTIRVTDNGDSPRNGAWVVYEDESVANVPSQRKIYTANRAGIASVVIYAERPVKSFDIRAVKDTIGTNYDISNISIYTGYYPD